MKCKLKSCNSEAKMFLQYENKKEHYCCTMHLVEDHDMGRELTDIGMGMMQSALGLGCIAIMMGIILMIAKEIVCFSCG